MVFQVVDFRLLEVADVSHAHGDFPDGEIKRQHLSERRVVVKRSEQHVLSFVSQGKHFVV